MDLIIFYIGQIWVKDMTWTTVNFGIPLNLEINTSSDPRTYLTAMTLQNNQVEGFETM